MSDSVAEAHHGLPVRGATVPFWYCCAGRAKAVNYRQTVREIALDQYGYVTTTDAAER